MLLLQLQLYESEPQAFSHRPTVEQLRSKRNYFERKEGEEEKLATGKIFFVYAIDRRPV